MKCRRKTTAPETAVRHRKTIHNKWQTILKSVKRIEKERESDRAKKQRINRLILNIRQLKALSLKTIYLEIRRIKGRNQCCLMMNANL